MQRPGLWVKLPSVPCVHLSICDASSLQLPPGPERCCWCGRGAVEQPWRWQFQAEDSINSLPLSRSISSFLVSEGFLLPKKQGKVIQPCIFHDVEDYKDEDLWLLVCVSGFGFRNYDNIKNRVDKMGPSRRCHNTSQTLVVEISPMLSTDTDLFHL